MNEWQQKGYDAWIEKWIALGCSPTATDCPARWMKADTDEQERKRADYLSGWNKAKSENMS